ncbi:MAG: argininosuccinate lyase [Acidimicrobiia bacterium]|nr:MAG: argininosuccinate lyase [Acidimicrobiia bacterium]
MGEVGEKLHTGRSRNDQVALDIRLHLRRSAAGRSEQIARLVGVLADLAETHAEVVVPSYTHLQQAQAVPLGHHLLAHAWALLRDRDRFADVGRRLDESPLGAGASAGSTLALDPSEAARRLGFSRVFRNSMDAVASRDLVSEYVWCCAQTMVDLSRLAEEVVLWSGTEFGWVTLPDSFTTGSSALPHKRNPDVAELARGRVGAAVGALVDLLVVQKALPLTYNRDLQQDKQAVFRADDLLAGTLEVLAPMLASARFHPPPPTPSVTALDLAEALVSRGVPFRQAHRAVGRLVARLENQGRDLGSVTYQDLAGAHPDFRPEDVSLADPSESVRRRATPGGGSVESVREQIRVLREILG